MSEEEKQDHTPVTKCNFMDWFVKMKEQIEAE